MNVKDALSSKHVQIDKANATMVAAIATASFLAIFSLFASKALWSQSAYQNRVIVKKEKARDQLKKNVDTATQLTTRYQAFVSSTQNVLGGNPTGQGANDGDNAKIILDALPSKYDFPAVATSLENLLTQNGLKTNSITGTDDEVAQGGNKSSPDPQVVEMPFQVSVTGAYTTIQNLTNIFEHSIRPIHIKTIQFTGSDSILTMNVDAITYYQPEKNLDNTFEVVK